MTAPMRVLLVEDDATIRQVITEALADEGFQVRAAGDGSSGLALLGGWQPHVIVLDLMMPGMDGWSFRAEQRRRQLALEVPLILLSASRHAPLAAGSLGAATALSKPFELEALLDAIGSVTRSTRIGMSAPVQPEHDSKT